MLGGADNPNGELPSYITGADNCERMHEQAEALYQKLSARFGIQDGE